MEQLINRLPEHLKSKIVVYYLGYGTPSAIIFRPIIKNSRLMRVYGLTCWQLFVVNHGMVRCRRLRMTTLTDALDELEMIIRQLIVNIF